MGGNALKNTTTRRYEKAEYEALSRDVLSKLQNVLFVDYAIKRELNILPAYREKQSFGDMDVLIETFSGDPIVWIDLIKKTYNPNEIFHNGNCYSFDVNEFQIDFILTPTEDYETSLAYFSWNDLGNLLGRIAKKKGFKYGHKGLSFLVRKNENIHSAFKEIIVSKDQKSILKFLGYDYENWLSGFDNLNEIFEFIASSSYFNKDIYLLENRNHVSRTRDKKREVYNKFLKWCDTTSGLPAYPWVSLKENDGYVGDKTFLQEALRTFDDFPPNYSKVLQELLFAERAQEKFNGEIVGNLLGLSGKDLGIWMSNFKKQFKTKEEMNAHLMHLTINEVEKLIKDFHVTTA